MTFEDVRHIMLALPGVEEGSSYGTPAFRVRKALLARLWEDGETLVVKVGIDEKEFLIEADPAVFFETDHYKGWPAVLVRLAVVEQPVLAHLLTQCWRAAAPKTLVKGFDAMQAG